MAPPSRRGVGILLGPGLTWVVLLFVVPSLLIIAYSFLTPKTGGGVELPFSVDTYRALLESDERASFYNNYLTLLIRSVGLAAVTTIITLLLGLPLAVYISRRKTLTIKYALLVAVMIPFWTSLLVRTYAIRFLFANTGPVNELLENLGFERVVFLNTTSAVLLGLVYTALPLMILPLYAAVERVDPRQIEAGRDLGASPLTVFFTVFLPLIRAGVSVGCVLVFVLSVSQFLVPTLLGGGKVNMIANLLQLQFGTAFNWPLGAGIATFLVALTLVSVVLLVRRRETVNLL